MSQSLNESQLVSVYVIYMFIKKLCTPFNETQAFKLGIIDADGKVLRQRYTLKTRQEAEKFLEELVQKNGGQNIIPQKV